MHVISEGTGLEEMWCRDIGAEPSSATGSCGGDSTPSDGQSEDEELAPEQVTIWSDGQLDNW